MKLLLIFNLLFYFINIVTFISFSIYFLIIRTKMDFYTHTYTEYSHQLTNKTFLLHRPITAVHGSAAKAGSVRTAEVGTKRSEIPVAALPTRYQSSQDPRDGHLRPKLPLRYPLHRQVTVGLDTEICRDRRGRPRYVECIFDRVQIRTRPIRRHGLY